MDDDLSEVEQILYALAGADWRAAVWCACRCARTVLPLAPPDDPDHRHVVELAEAWVQGLAAAEAAGELALRASTYDMDGFPANTAQAVSAAAAYVCPDTPRYELCKVPDHAAVAVAYDRDPGAGTAWMEALEEHLAHLLALVRSERWPRTFPTAEQLAAAPEAVAVAWDAVADDRPDHGIPELLEAHARAERLGLDWREPPDRAVAERATDEARVRGLLSPRGAP